MLRGRNPAQLDFHSPRTFGTYSATMIRAALLLVLAAVGCATVLPGSRVDASVAPSPAQSWIPPKPLPAPRPPEPDPSLVAQIKPGMQVTLQQLLAYALSNNPQTRSAWLNARAAAAGAAARGRGHRGGRSAGEDAAFPGRAGATASGGQRGHRARRAGHFAGRVRDAAGGRRRPARAARGAPVG